jgi:FkbM family methyltransferase
VCPIEREGGCNQTAQIAPTRGSVLTDHQIAQQAQVDQIRSYIAVHRAISNVGHKVLSTESEWNPKVILGRALTAVLPERTLHRMRKAYYAYLLSHAPDSWQEKESAVVRHLVRPGDWVIDVGASIGGYTRFLSDLVGSSGRVYSFEPHPPIYEYLSYNVKRLKLYNVELSDSALSDKQGTALIAIPRYRWGSECHYDATLEVERTHSDCRQVEVAVTTMDAFYADLRERISFVKCDVNYHELACLRGGMQTLKRCQPAILIEILPNPDRPGSHAAQVFDLLKQYGYKGYWFDGEHLRARQSGERSQNYFFLMDEHKKLLPSELFPNHRDKIRSSGERR